MGWSNLLLQAGSRLPQLLDLGLEYGLDVLCVLLGFSLDLERAGEGWSEISGAPGEGNMPGGSSWLCVL